MYSKKFSVKLPKNIKLIYYTNLNRLILVGPLGRKLVDLKLKIFLYNHYIYITKIQTSRLKDNRKQAIKALRGTTVAILKQMIIEVSVILYKKIKFIGVGYKVLPVYNYEGRALQLKLGFSHMLFFKIPLAVKLTIFRFTRIFIFGTSYSQICQIAATIRSYKVPEPYKGKGILYANEKIKLKRGKRV